MFTDSSIINNTNVNLGAAAVQTLQTGGEGSVQTLSPAASQAINKASGLATFAPPVKVPGQAAANVIGGLGKATGAVGGAFNTVGDVLGAAASIQGAAKNIVGNVENMAAGYLNSAIKSVTSTFGGAVNSLASGLNSKLGSIFKNTNIKSASNVISNISDPVQTNLLDSKPPASSSFKISSLEAGSQTVTMAGSSPQFGTQAGGMIGTGLSTVLNRLNINSIGNLGSKLTDAKSKSGINGLFSSAKNIVGTVSTVVKTAREIKNLPGQIVNSVAKGLNGQLQGLQRGVVNDVQSFMGRASSLQDATGVDPMSFFLNNGKTSLFDQDGLIVDTNGSGVDATTGNSLLDLARLIGCDPGTLNFNSANEIMSLYNLILGLATKESMKTLVDSLLNCSMGNSLTGQTAITNAFSDSTYGDIEIAGMLIDKVDNKAALNVDYITDSLVTNTNLKASDKGQVDYLMVSMGTTTKKAYTVKSASQDGIDVYNLNTLYNSNKNFMDAAFDDKALSTYLYGTPMEIKSDGSFTMS